MKFIKVHYYDIYKLLKKKTMFIYEINCFGLYKAFMKRKALFMKRNGFEI